MPVPDTSLKKYLILALAGATAQANSFIKCLAAEDECGSTSVRSSEEESFSKSIKFSPTKSRLWNT